MYCENPYYNLNYDQSDCGELMNHLSWDSIGFTENRGSDGPMMMMPVKQSLVLDVENGELVKDSGRRIMGKKTGDLETKTKIALKSHSDAERRRRERINAHLETLRGLVPSKEKMDKATLLAQVINQVKQLKTTAKQATEGLHVVPMDTDDVQVEILENNNNAGKGSFLLRASICCDYRPELLSDLRQTINDLPHVRVSKCEISTLGDRVKSVFLITTDEKTKENTEARELIVRSVRAALCDILDKLSASAEYAEPLFFPRKRQRASYLDSS